MEDKKLKRVFDRVQLPPGREEAMLADLLNEEKEVSTMEQTNRRRFPTAALAAAALVLVLAGTALAAGYFERVKLDLIDDWTDGISREQKEGYAVYMPEGRIPVESLTDELIAACPEKAKQPDTGGYVYFPFKSWSDGEAFLGLELADNARLEQMNKRRIHYCPPGEEREARSHCLLNAGYFEGLPVSLTLSADYEENNCFVQAWAEMAVSGSDDLPGHRDPYGVSAAFQGETDFQEYVTPSGLEVTIYSETVTTDYGKYGIHDRVIYRAHFIKNNALFTVQLLSDEAWQTGRENLEFLDPWDTLIEILDAYE